MTDKEHKGKEILKEALGDYELSFDEKYPPEEMDVVFSKKYQKNIDRMLSGKQKSYPKFLNSSWKRVVASIVVVAMVFGGSMTVKAFREPVVEFFTNIYEKIVEIFFDDDDIAKAPSEIETIYTLGYVPDGYVEESFDSDELTTKIYWTNGDDKIYFKQYTLDSETHLDNEISDYQIFCICDIKIAMIEKYGKRILFWNDDEYAFTLTMSVDVSEEDYVNMIKSTVEKD